VALDCLEGLIALHEKGVTHMDFKKQNTVLVNGRVKLIDIGFALDSERADRYTMQTTSYAAPGLFRTTY
jgi:serine/threonine protein kinase